MNTSCNNLIKIAEKALFSNKYLKKVIILKHAPRFDNVKNKKLAEKANIILTQLLGNSKLKEKIAIGSHNLDDFGIGHTHNRRYGDSTVDHYDGVHYMGSSGSLEYTKSLTTIIFNELPELSNMTERRCAEPLPIFNRFSTLQEGN